MASSEADRKRLPERRLAHRRPECHNRGIPTAGPTWPRLSPSSVTAKRPGSAGGKPTGRTDIPLTPEGERKAALLGQRLAGQTFERAFTSPLQRAARTCALAGFGDRAIADPDLVEKIERFF